MKTCKKQFHKLSHVLYMSQELLSSKMYIIETIRIDAWNFFLKCSVNNFKDYFAKNDIFFDQKKILQNIINYNTFVIGMDNLNFYVVLPKIKNLVKHQNILMKELEYTIGKNINTHRDKIMNYIITCNKNAKNKMKQEIDKIILQKINAMVSPTNSDKIKLETNVHPNKFVISKNHYSRLKRMFRGPKEDVDLWICILLLRYRYYTFLKEGISLSVDIIYDYIKKNGHDDISLEAFAGSLNSNLSSYCSLFYDIEKYFGSKGSFLLLNPNCDYEIIVSNPPYVEEIMTFASVNLIKYFDKCSDTNVFVVVTIPDWRSVSEFESDKNVQVNFSGKQQERIETSYSAYYILRNSKYFRDVFFIGSYQYYNFFKDEKRLINANTLIIFLSTHKNNKYCNELKHYIQKELKQ